MFLDEYEYDYFFTENMNGNAQCLICHRILINNNMQYYIKRHYKTCHGEFSQIVGSDRKLKLYELQAIFFLIFMANEYNDEKLPALRTNIENLTPLKNNLLPLKYNNEDLSPFEYNNENSPPLTCNENSSPFQHANENLATLNCGKGSSQPLKTANEVNNISRLEKASLKRASFVVSLALAKQCRPFDDGPFFLNLTSEVLVCFGEKAAEILKLFQKIPLSRHTVARRTEQISDFIYFETKKRLHNCKKFSIALDESTDINDICQLVIYVKTVDEKLVTFEEVLNVIPFHGNVTGQVLYDVLKTNVFSIVDKQKLSSICSDGAKVMRGECNGLLGILRKNGVDCPAFHCVIHQQVLFSKQLNITHTMNIAVKIINKIRGGHNSLSHRKFKALLEGLDTDYGDLLLYTEVRWLSKGKSLERLFTLRKEVLLFLKENPKMKADELIAYLEDGEFQLNLAFLCDVTEILNDLNLTLQGRNISICRLHKTIQNFYRKLNILTEQIKNNNLTNLKKTSALLSELQINSVLKTQSFVEIFDSLKKNFCERFKDLNTIEKIIKIHDDPFNCKIEEQPEDLQEELKKLKEDPEISLDIGENFWKNLSDSKYCKLKNEIYSLYSMFGTTYNCEAAFSSLKIILSRLRNRLSDRHVTDLLRIKEYRGGVDLNELIEKIKKNLFWVIMNFNYFR